MVSFRYRRRYQCTGKFPENKGFPNSDFPRNTGIRDSIFVRRAGVSIPQKERLIKDVR